MPHIPPALRFSVQKSSTVEALARARTLLLFAEQEYQALRPPPTFELSPLVLVEPANYSWVETLLSRHHNFALPRESYGHVEGQVWHSFENIWAQCLNCRMTG